MYRMQGSQAAVAPTQSLLGQVLGITGAGFLITAASAYLFQGVVSYGISLVAMLAGLGFLFAISGTRNNPALSLVMFYVFTFLEGIGIAPIIARYVQSGASEAVVNAAATTGVGMLVLAGVVYATGIDFRRFSGIAFIALIALVLIGVVSLFVRFIHPETYSWLTLGIFTLLVLIDFSRIRAGGGGSTAVELATSIYLDAINIFLALLSLFGGRRRD